MKAFLFFLLAFCWLCNAQTEVDAKVISTTVVVPGVVLLSLTPSDESIVLDLGTVTEAGESIQTSASDDSKWLHYTSSVAVNGNLRNVAVQIVSGQVPSGMVLSLSAGAYEGLGQGTHGTPTAPVPLALYPQKILTGIGGAYTDAGIGSGHQLFYHLQITNYDLLDFDESTVLTIVFTLSDN